MNRAFLSTEKYCVSKDNSMFFIEEPCVPKRTCANPVLALRTAVQVLLHGVPPGDEAPHARVLRTGRRPRHGRGERSRLQLLFSKRALKLG